MNIKELEKICLSTCFRFINDKVVYPSQKSNMSFMIIYPTDGYYLTKEQFISIFEVIKKYQDSYYCISDIEFEDSFTREGNTNDLGYNHKIFTNFVYDDYKAKDRLFENALYDIDKKWGISIFQDSFAIIFGENEIIKEIKANYPNDDDLKEFNKFIESEAISNINFKNQLLILSSNSI